MFMTFFRERTNELASPNSVIENLKFILIVMDYE